jgi:hypothetical protein
MKEGIKPELSRKQRYLRIEIAASLDSIAYMGWGGVGQDKVGWGRLGQDRNSEKQADNGIHRVLAG